MSVRIVLVLSREPSESCDSGLPGRLLQYVNTTIILRNVFLMSTLMYRVVNYYLQKTLGANISGSKKVREDTQHASESWTSQLSREKKILKIGAWVTELFHFLSSYSDFVRAETFFSDNSYVSEPISKILFSSESLTWQLLEENKILKIGSTAGERGIFDSSRKAEWAVLGWPFIFSNEVTNRLREIGHLDNDRWHLLSQMV